MFFYKSSPNFTLARVVVQTSHLQAFRQEVTCYMCRWADSGDFSHQWENPDSFDTDDSAQLEVSFAMQIPYTCNMYGISFTNSSVDQPILRRDFTNGAPLFSTLNVSDIFNRCFTPNSKNQTCFVTSVLWCLTMWIVVWFYLPPFWNVCHWQTCHHFLNLILVLQNVQQKVVYCVHSEVCGLHTVMTRSWWRCIHAMNLRMAVSAGRPPLSRL